MSEEVQESGLTIEELGMCTVTFPKAGKGRKKGIAIDLAKNHDLRKAILRCLETGQEEYVRPAGGTPLYYVSAEYPLIESAMKEQKNKSLLKISVTVYSTAHHMGVRA